MTADAEHPLVCFEEIELPGRLVNAVTGETGHRIAGAGVPGLFSQWMADAVFVGVAGTAELDGIFGKEQRLLAAVRTVTGRAIEALVSQMSSLLPRCCAARIVALRANCLGLSSHQTRTLPGMGIVASGALTTTGRNMREGRGNRFQDNLSVAIATELVDRPQCREWFRCTGTRMTAAAVAAVEGSVHRLPEEPTLRRGVWLVALMTGRSLNGVAPMSGGERVVGLMTPQAHGGAALVEEAGDRTRVGIVAGRATSLGKRPVLDPARLPAGDLLVACAAEILARLDEEALMVAAMGLVTVGAFALGHRPVDERAAFLSLDIAVALGAEWTGLLSQQSAKSGHMWVVTGSALSTGDRCVCHLGSQCIFQVVAAETDLLLIDLMARRGLSGDRRQATKQSTHDQNEP